MESILQFHDKYDVDDSIMSYEYHEYQPISGTQLNSAGQITITIENQDEFFHPRRSYLVVEGKLVKENNTPYVDDDMIALTNNGIMFLFSNLKYDLSGQEIESVNHPGQASTLLGMVKYSPNFSKGPGMNQCWYPDTSNEAAVANSGFTVRHSYLIQKPNPKGTFSFAIDLEHMLGFCEDYEKVIYGFRHTLTLVRTSNSNAIYRAAGVDEGKTELTKIEWMMPRVQPSDVKKFTLYKSIESKSTLESAFRMRQCDMISLPATSSFTWRLGVRSAPEKPRYIIIGLQTAKSGQQERNPAIFDHCNTTNMYVVLNSTRYPATDFNANFTKNQYSRFYKELVDFRLKYYGIDTMLGNTCVHPNTYKELFPLFVFDVSKQSERLNQGVVDITVKMEFGENVRADTDAYAVVISDRVLKFQSDGKKMNVVF